VTKGGPKSESNVRDNRYSEKRRGTGGTASLRRGKKKMGGLGKGEWSVAIVPGTRGNHTQGPRERGGVLQKREKDWPGDSRVVPKGEISNSKKS